MMTFYYNPMMHALLPTSSLLVLTQIYDDAELVQNVFNIPTKQEPISLNTFILYTQHSL